MCRLSKMVKLFSKRSANIEYVFALSIYKFVWKMQHTCCESCSVVPIWVVSLYQMTWACGSACTTQINCASWPTPVCTNGRSTSISGGSINNRYKKLNQWHPMYHSSCRFILMVCPQMLDRVQWFVIRKCELWMPMWTRIYVCIVLYTYALILQLKIRFSCFRHRNTWIQHHIHTKQIIQRQCRRKMVDYLMSFSAH